MKQRILAVIASAALLGACNDNPTVNDLNNVSAETIAGGLTTASAQLLTTGLLNQYRNSAIGNWVTFPESMARDAMRLDKAESRYVTEIFGSSQPDYSAFSGGGAFTGFFTGIRTANVLIDAANAATPASSGMTAAQLQGLVGIGQTMKALMYWNVMETRDTVGMPIALDVPITAPPATWCDKPSVYAYISALLDSGNTALAAAGSGFAVTLPSGYTTVAGTPAGFAQFNRGLKAKVELYRAIPANGVGTPNAANLTAALTAINASFMSIAGVTATTLQNGVYENYSTNPGETTNARVDNALHLNPAIVDSAQAGDTRLSKVITQATAYTQTFGTTVLSTKYDYIYSVGGSSLTVPLPILKNEELVLLRAQIAIEQNDMPNANTYLNAVRTQYGLAPYAFVAGQQAQARNALLYEKRYSLLMEGPQRLVDLRAYGRMNATSWTKGASSSSPFSGDVYNKVLPVPLNEVSARGGAVPTPVACP